MSPLRVCCFYLFNAQNTRAHTPASLFMLVLDMKLGSWYLHSKNFPNGVSYLFSPGSSVRKNGEIPWKNRSGPLCSEPRSVVFHTTQSEVPLDGQQRPVWSAHPLSSIHLAFALAPALLLPALEPVRPFVGTLLSKSLFVRSHLHHSSSWLQPHLYHSCSNFLLSVKPPPPPIFHCCPHFPLHSQSVLPRSAVRFTSSPLFNKLHRRLGSHR